MGPDGAHSTSIRCHHAFIHLLGIIKSLVSKQMGALGFRPIYLILSLGFVRFRSWMVGQLHLMVGGCQVMSLT